MASKSSIAQRIVGTILVLLYIGLTLNKVETIPSGVLIVLAMIIVLFPTVGPLRATE